MSVPERIPLPETDDGAERMILQQKDPARGQPGRTLGQCRGLVGGMHKPKQSMITSARLGRPGRSRAALGQQTQPGSAMGATVLGYQTASRQQVGHRDPLRGVDRLCHESGWLDSFGSSGTVGSASN